MLTDALAAYGALRVLTAAWLIPAIASLILTSRSASILQGPVNVARACREVGARLVYMSSDQVYNACPVGVPLCEEQAVSPRGPYACHKLQAECAIARELPGAAVSLRLTWMYDDPRSPLRAAAHLLRRLAEARRTGHPLRLAVNDHRGLTDVRHVVERMDLASPFLPGCITSDVPPASILTKPYIAP